MQHARSALPLLGALLVAPAATAATTEIGPADDIQGAIAALTPGDELVLQGGTYDLSFRFSIGVVGTAAEPIVIRAKAGEVPIITRPDANQNTINVEGARHLVLRGLEITGGSHGIRMNDARFVTIDDCHVHHTGDVAISANVVSSTYEALRIVGNHIHDTGGTGEGMYLGCNDAGCVMFDSVIERNHVHDTTGTSQGDGIEVKHGSYGNVVRDNVVHDTGYPCIIAYGTEGGTRNLIEGNVVWGCGNNGLQIAADAVVRNNLVLGAVANGIHSQIHQGATPGNLDIVHNTVVVSGTALRVNDIAAAVVIANNALYSQSASAIQVGGNTALLTVVGNAGVGTLSGLATGFDASGDVAIDFVSASFAGGAMNVYPAVGSLLIGAGDAAYVAAVDFDGTPRTGSVESGAYEYESSGSALWTVAAEPKTTSAVEPTASGGAGGSGGASSGGTTAVGGSSAMGGSGAMGGSSAMGGSGAMGGSSAMGGVTGASGGSSAMGGVTGASGGSGGTGVSGMTGSGGGSVVGAAGMHRGDTDGGDATGANGSDDSAGCACAVGSARPSAFGTVVSLLALVALGRRRRRRRGRFPIPIRSCASR